MKKLILALGVVLAMSACTNSTVRIHKDADTTLVDSTMLDTATVDSLGVDTTLHQ